MTQKQFFGVFQLFVSEIKPFYQKKTFGRIRNDLKHEITLAKNLLRK